MESFPTNEAILKTFNIPNIEAEVVISTNHCKNYTKKQSVRSTSPWEIPLRSRPRDDRHSSPWIMMMMVLTIIIQ